MSTEYRLYALCFQTLKAGLKFVEKWPCDLRVTNDIKRKVLMFFSPSTLLNVLYIFLYTFPKAFTLGSPISYYLQTMSFLAAWRITACVTTVEDNTSDLLCNHLHLTQRFCWASYLPVLLHHQQHRSKRYSQQYQFLLFTRMSSSMKLLVYRIKIVAGTQSIVRH